MNKKNKLPESSYKIKKDTLTEKENNLLIKMEQQMRDHAIAIASINSDMKDIYYGGSRKAMQGIIDYLYEKKAPQR